MGSRRAEGARAGISGADVDGRGGGGRGGCEGAEGGTREKTEEKEAVWSGMFGL